MIKKPFEMVIITDTSVFGCINDAKKAIRHLNTLQNILLVAGIEFFNHFTNRIQFSASSIAGKANASGTICPFPSTGQAARKIPLIQFLI
jgi:hypothetical protein